MAHAKTAPLTTPTVIIEKALEAPHPFAGDLKVPFEIPKGPKMKRKRAAANK